MLVTGAGGTRIDFIAGWLGTLPGFINNKWSINPVTGASFSDSCLTKQIDYEPNTTVEKYMKEQFEVEIDPTASHTFCGSLHGFGLHARLENSSAVKIIHIAFDDSSWHKINWDFFVKTYLTTPSLRHYSNSPNEIKFTPMYRIARHPDSIVVDYEKLFVPGGSRYLCDKLEITVPDKHHEFYNDMLKWADSPLEIEAHGKVWKFSDYFPE